MPLTRRTATRGLAAFTLAGDQPCPTRLAETLPLSDPHNRGGWTLDPAFTDDFRGTALDAAKWHATNPEWPGRPPGLFRAENVRVAGGQLHIDLRRGTPPADLQRRGYHDWTSGAVQSRARVRYGYFEVRSRPMRSVAASTFWFYARDPARWTEIDVYETWPGAAGMQRLLSTNTHIFDMPAGKPDHTDQQLWTAPFDIAADFHVYGLDWGPDSIGFYVDGGLIRRVPNTGWHQPLTLNLDVEIMPDIAGLPRQQDLGTYSIDYVRGFRRGAAWNLGTGSG